MSTVKNMAERYNPFTGKQIVPGLDDPVPDAAVLGLEPPRFCEQCGRRMVVQIDPNGWSARCSRHEAITSTARERR